MLLSQSYSLKGDFQTRLSENALSPPTAPARALSVSSILQPLTVQDHGPQVSVVLKLIVSKPSTTQIWRIVTTIETTPKWNTAWNTLDELHLTALKIQMAMMMALRITQEGLQRPSENVRNHPSAQSQMLIAFSKEQKSKAKPFGPQVSAEWKPIATRP